MSLLQYENEKHKQRQSRLWNPNPPRRPISATPTSAPVVTVASPPAAVVPIISLEVPAKEMTAEEVREQRLCGLQDDLRVITERLNVELLQCSEARLAELQIPFKIILETVGAYFGISVALILSSRRHRRICLPRHIVMFLANDLTFRSLPEIGRRLGNRDHTTVLHGVQRIRGLLLTDAKLKSDVEKLTAMLTVAKAPS